MRKRRLSWGAKRDSPKRPTWEPGTRWRRHPIVAWGGDSIERANQWDICGRKSHAHPPEENKISRRRLFSAFAETLLNSNLHWAIPRSTTAAELWNRKRWKPARKLLGLHILQTALRRFSAEPGIYLLEFILQSVDYISFQHDSGRSRWMQYYWQKVSTNRILANLSRTYRCN